MSTIQQQMLKYINLARTTPSYFIPILQKQLASFTNDKQIPLNEQIIYETNEGKTAWVEALAFLRRQKPIPALEPHQGLSNSSRDHAHDLATHNIFGHTGSDGSTFSQRILRYCRKGSGSMAQLIGADFHYENRNHAQLTILGLIIDDGVPDRGHRKTIFNEVYKQVGCKTEVQGEKVVTVFNMTENRLGLRGGTGGEREGRERNERQREEGMSSSMGMMRVKSPGKPFGNTVTYNKGEMMMKGMGDPQQDRFSKTQWTPQSKPSSHSPKPSSYISTTTPTPTTQNNPSPFDNLSSTPKASKLLTTISSSMNRKLKEKKESSKIYYQEGSKITEITTKLVYNDGTVEENVERHTVYLEQ